MKFRQCFLGLHSVTILIFLKNSSRLSHLLFLNLLYRLILNALTWHKGGANKSGEDRGIIVIDYRKRNHKQLLNLKMYIDKETIDSFNENEKYLFGLRKEDVFQKERSFGPGAKYKKWLEENPKFNYKK